MRLSVIVPVYNTEAYLPRCIDSILDQSFTDFELILVDDGSTDRSYEICLDYARKDRRVTVLHKENSGQADARNMALDMAQSEFVTFIDSDDYVDTEMFRYLLDAADRNDADIVTCELACVDENDRPIGQLPPEHEDIVVDGDQLLRHFYHTDDAKGYTSGVVCAKLHRRCLFDRLRFPSGKIYEDTFVVPYLYENTRRLVLTSKPFYKYMMRGNSTMNHTFRKKNLDVLYVMEDQCRFFAQRPRYGQTHQALSTYMRYYVRTHYTVHLFHPELRTDLKPYTKRFKKHLGQILKNPITCRMEKLCILWMLLCPKSAVKATWKYFPESLSEPLIQQLENAHF